MNKFSPDSLKKLALCHTQLQALCHAVLAKTDFTILCGVRGKKEQDEAYLTGHSKAQWGESPHNYVPSLAVDLAPYPIDWKDEARFDALAVIVKEAAKELGIEITWGGDFKSFKDKPHFELKLFQQIKKVGKL